MESVKARRWKTVTDILEKRSVTRPRAMAKAAKTEQIAGTTALLNADWWLQMVHLICVCQVEKIIPIRSGKNSLTCQWVWGYMSKCHHQCWRLLLLACKMSGRQCLIKFLINTRPDSAQCYANNMFLFHPLSVKPIQHLSVSLEYLFMRTSEGQHFKPGTNFHNISLIYGNKNTYWNINHQSTLGPSNNTW